MPEEKEYLTKEKLAELKKELEFLMGTRRKEIAEKLEYAKSLGDLSENAEYQETKEEQSLVEGKIAEMEETIRTATLITKNRITDEITVGSTIRVHSLKGEETYTIVGSEEADPLTGKISNESPLGRAFIGHRRGDKVEIKTPGGSTIYEILEIR